MCLGDPAGIPLIPEKSINIDRVISDTLFFIFVIFSKP